MYEVFYDNAPSNNSMGVRAKQRISYLSYLFALMSRDGGFAQRQLDRLAGIPVLLGNEMTELHSEASPRLKARLAGLFQLLEGMTATFGQVYLLGTFVVPRNPAATTANILANETLFQIGFAASLIAVGFHLGRTLFIYELFKIVNKSLSLFAVFVILVGCALQAVTSLFYLATLTVLKGVNSALTTEQLQELAYMSIRLNAQTFNIYLVFFGLWCFLVGYLIYKSTFMPRILGILMMITGLGWMTHLYPPLSSRIFPVIATASALGEIPLLLWLLVKGVNVQQWKEHARIQRF